jgi:hypothetical protein
MPFLLIEHAGQKQAARVSGRVLIGRITPGGVVLPEEQVSRIHAWIDRSKEGRFYIADATSRTGTLLGGQPLQGRHNLSDGDLIEIGSSRLTWREAADLPEGVPELHLARDGAAPVPVSGGVLFACPCGAPLWAPLEWMSRRGACNACQRRVLVPPLPGAPQTDAPDMRSGTVAGVPAITKPASAKQVPPQVPAQVPAPDPWTVGDTASTATVPTTLCSVCQWSIEPGDVRMRCPSCGLLFHAECWKENRGCSAYGCAQVGVLEESSDADTDDMPRATSASSAADANEQATDAAAAEELAAAEAQSQFPAKFLLLGAAVVLSILGLFAFGLPAALVTAYANVHWYRSRRDGVEMRRTVLILAILLSLGGFAVGLWFSCYWWLGRRLMPGALSFDWLFGR